MFNRRSFLMSIAALTVSQLVSGCGNNNAVLKILLLEGSIPPQLLREFRNNINLGIRVSLKPKEQLAYLFELLEIWQETETEKTKKNNWFNWIPGEKKQSSPVDLLTLGNYWLKDAISKKLIQPLNLDDNSNWQNLPQPWQQLVKRNQQGKLDDRGRIWGAPYRWGSTMIVYDQDKFRSLGWQPKDWADLWKEELNNHFSLLDEPREVIGLTLKKFGYSYNTENLSKVRNLKSELIKLNQQVKFYSSNHYLQPLILGDTWLAVGWSSDILPIVQKYPNLKAIIPQSGTSLWADLWVQPTPLKTSSSKSSDLINSWIDFCWRSESASKISLFTNAASPIILTMDKGDLPQDIKKNPLLLADRQILEKSEFIEPINQQEYLSLWRKVRQA